MTMQRRDDPDNMDFSRERFTCAFHTTQVDNLRELDEDMKELAKAIASGLKEVNETVSKKVSMVLFVWIIGIIIAILGSNYGLWLRNMEGYSRLITKDDWSQYRQDYEARLHNLEEKIDEINEKIMRLHQ